MPRRCKNMMYGEVVKKLLVIVAVLCGTMLLSNSAVQAQPATLSTDLATWQSLLTAGTEEVFETTSGNILLADEVSVAPVTNVKVGPILTFQSANTPLSRGFQLESLQATDPTNPLDGGFTFNDTEGGAAYADALSPGDVDDFQNDDWTLTILDGVFISALGFNVKHARFPADETLTLFSNGTVVDEFKLDDFFPATGNGDFFIGLTSNTPFNRIDFNEEDNAADNGDDIAIADFRFANTTVVPEPVSSTLFIIGGVAFGLRSWRKKKMTA